MYDQRGTPQPGRQPIGRHGGLVVLTACLAVPTVVLASPHLVEPAPSVVATPSGHAVPTVAASVVAAVKAPHTPDPKLVKAPMRPQLPPSSQRRLEPDGLGIRTHDPSLRETIREVAEERTAHDQSVEHHNQAAQRGIRQTMANADTMAALAARERETHEGFWYHLFHGR